MKKIAYSLTIITLILGLTGCSATSSSAQASNTQPPVSSQIASQSPPAYKVGDAQKVGQFQLKVNSVKTTNGGQYLKPSDGDKFVFVDITLENQGSENELISSMAMFDLVNKDGRKAKFTMPEKMDTIDGTLGAGRKITGELGYEVSNSDKDFDLVFTTSEVDGSQGVVKISI